MTTAHPQTNRDRKVAGPRLPGSMMNHLKAMHMAHMARTKDIITFADWFADLMRSHPALAHFAAGGGT